MIVHVPIVIVNVEAIKHKEFEYYYYARKAGITQYVRLSFRRIAIIIIVKAMTTLSVRDNNKITHKLSKN